MCNLNIDKAETLNKHCHGVINKPQSNITLFDDVPPFESIPSLSINTNDVLCQPKPLNLNKANGPDKLSL